MRRLAAVLAAIVVTGVLLASSSAGSILDPTPPVITYAIEGQIGDNDWYTSNVVLKWFFSDPESGIKGFAGCAWVTLTTDTPGVTQTCAVTNNANITSVVAVPLKLDKAPPQVTSVSPDRQADYGGWYNHSVGFAYGGADATSGLAGCSTVAYSGPDSVGAAVTGSCRDRAGNTSAPVGVSFKYDATPPSLGKATVDARDHGALLRWTASSDTAAVEVVREAQPKGSTVTVFRGRARAYRDKRLKNGHRYRYLFRAIDQAGNSATRTVTAVSGEVVSPAEGVQVGSPPLLAWVPAAKATYYNVQIFRGKHKILSAWPAHAHLVLRRSWTYGGKRYRLRRGEYRWAVWPGLGPRSAQRYGPLLGTSAFVFAP